MIGQLNLAQHGVWFTEQAGGAPGTAYQMGVAIRFGAGLDRTALAAACAAVMARHPVLGAAIRDRDGGPSLVAAADPVTLTTGPLLDSSVPEEMARPFRLDAGPLVRFRLFSVDSDDRHVLVVTAHHIVFDGVSKEILVRDLAAAYGAAVAWEPVPAFDVAGQLTRVESLLPAAREYWRGNWSGAGDIILPGLRRTPTSVEPGASVEFDLGAKDLPDIGVTRFEAFLAALHALLARYGNAGAPVALAMSTRTADVASHIGLFVNELPLAVAPAAGSFRSYARDLRARLRELYQFREVPLAHAVGVLPPKPGLTPMSVSYRRRIANPVFDGVESTVDWMLYHGTAANAMHIQLVDGLDGVAVSLRYSPSAIDRDSVTRIGEHLRNLLDAATANPDAPVAELAVLSDEERIRIVNGFTATRRDRRADATVPSLFAEQARAHPDAVAVVDSGRTYTYAELDAASAALAGQLSERGIGPGSRVGVMLPRSWDAVVTLLAVMRTRAAFVPVDPHYPPARRALILEDANPHLVLAEPPTIAETSTVELPTVEPGDIAYVMYTSGSTGRPKGVVISHAGLAHFLTGFAEVLDARPTDRWLAVTSPSFDPCMLEHFLPLTTGGRLVISGDVANVGGVAVAELVRAEGVTHVQATPSVWRILLDAGFDASGVTAFTGGESLTTGLARELRARVGRLANIYGPTEVSVWSTLGWIDDPTDISVGRPIGNTRAYVLDRAMRPLPVGIPGELHLAGAGVGYGYLGRSGHTAETFVPDPYDPAGGRLYRTGDLASWLPDGRLAHHGRTDHQIKIRGHRVEPGEIESRLREHPGVSAAAVAVRGAGDGAELVGYLIPAGAYAPEPAELRQHLAASLLPATIPTRWVTLNGFPMTPSGKLDRNALPDPPRERPEATRPAAPAPTPAGDEVLDKLLAIWRDVLQIRDIGLDDDLFDLGAHSLSITRINSRTQQELGVSLPLDAYFDTPTIAEIADLIRQKVGSAR